jgi:nucleoside-diphosphate-sugar epimerase
MRILITGATGFIGRHLVARLAGEHEIWALVRRLPSTRQENVQYVQQDLSRPLDRGSLPEKLEAIIHQAAVIDPDASRDDAHPFLVNVVATWRLLEYAAAAQVHTFVHASTGGVYGCSERPLRETDGFNPMDTYSLTKAQAELAVQAAPGSFHKIILRYFFVYGPGTPNPIPSYVQRAVTGQPIRILQSGKPTLNPIHIADATEATIRVLELGASETLNIAGIQETTFADMADMAAQVAGRLSIFQPIPDEAAIPYYRSDLVADTQRMRTVLEFVPCVTLAAGISALAESYM